LRRWNGECHDGTLTVNGAEEAERVPAVAVIVAVILEMDTTGGATTTGAADVDAGLLLGATAAEAAGAVAVAPDLKPFTGPPRRFPDRRRGRCRREHVGGTGG